MVVVAVVAVVVVVQKKTNVTRAAYVVVARCLRLIRLKACVRCHRADENRYYLMFDSDVVLMSRLNTEAQKVAVVVVVVVVVRTQCRACLYPSLRLD